jgi:hypothetical protein
MKIGKKTLKLARQYAELDREYENPDMNAAIDLARALLRATRTSAPKAKIVASALSDDQIAEVIDIGNDILRNAHAALDTSRTGLAARRAARVRCAEILTTMERKS